MPFLTPNIPQVDPAEFLTRPRQERLHFLANFWVEYGFGTPRMIHTTYIAKLLVVYLGIGLTLITTTSDLGKPWEVTSWWDEPIVYQKLVLWTMFLETVGIAGSWGPLAGKFKPMTGGLLFWLRPGTIRMPPWADKVPGTSGDTRTPFDVLLYAGLLVSLFVPVVLDGEVTGGIATVLPGNSSGLVRPELMIAPLVLLVLVGLRDKTIFIAARSEQYAPALVAFGLVGLLGGSGFVDMIVAAQAADRERVGRRGRLQDRRALRERGAADGVQRPRGSPRRHCAGCTTRTSRTTSVPRHWQSCWPTSAAPSSRS